MVKCQARRKPHAGRLQVSTYIEIFSQFRLHPLLTVRYNLKLSLRCLSLLKLFPMICTTNKIIQTRFSVFVRTIPRTTTNPNPNTIRV